PCSTPSCLSRARSGATVGLTSPHHPPAPSLPRCRSSQSEASFCPKKCLLHYLQTSALGLKYGKSLQRKHDKPCQSQPSEWCPQRPKYGKSLRVGRKTARSEHGNT